MSNAAQRVKSIAEFVRHYLESNSQLKDSDEKLIARFWYDQASRLGYNPRTTNLENGLRLLAEGKFTSAEDIVRCRRQLQAKHPDLRGVKWNVRQEKEKEVRKEINES